MSTPQWIEPVTSIATALGLFAGVQLLLQKRQATTQFEDELAKQYRDIVRELPIQAHFGEPVTDEDHKASLRDVLSMSISPTSRSFCEGRAVYVEIPGGIGATASVTRYGARSSRERGRRSSAARRRAFKSSALWRARDSR